MSKALILIAAAFFCVEGFMLIVGRSEQFYRFDVWKLSFWQPSPSRKRAFEILAGAVHALGGAVLLFLICTGQAI